MFRPLALCLPLLALLSVACGDDDDSTGHGGAGGSDGGTNFLGGQGGGAGSGGQGGGSQQDCEEGTPGGTHTCQCADGTDGIRMCDSRGIPYGSCQCGDDGPDPGLCTKGGSQYGEASEENCKKCQQESMGVGGCCEIPVTICEDDSFCSAIVNCVKQCGDSEECPQICVEQYDNGYLNYYLRVSCLYGCKQNKETGACDEACKGQQVPQCIILKQ